MSSSPSRLRASRRSTLPCSLSIIFPEYSRWDSVMSARLSSPSSFATTSSGVNPSSTPSMKFFVAFITRTGSSPTAGLARCAVAEPSSSSDEASARTCLITGAARRPRTCDGCEPVKVLCSRRVRAFCIAPDSNRPLCKLPCPPWVLVSLPWLNLAPMTRKSSENRAKSIVEIVDASPRGGGGEQVPRAPSLRHLCPALDRNR
mmetsp:Transcript_2890/g.10525  ORF Transcript_2890/g.10525 Transcript_2890/m.10525 type:complete len:203 (+) Transcript_2890:3681-4289(+)